MTNRHKAKGDRAEREVAGILCDLLGVKAQRALGAGRKEDVGDVFGVPDTVVQVVNWRDVAAAVRHKPVEAELQRIRAQASHVATFVRLRGGDYRVVLTPDQWAALWREALEV